MTLPSASPGRYGREQAEKDLATATVKTLAHYTLPQVPKESQPSTNAFATALTDAVGRERAELILPSAESWMQSLGVFDRDPKPVTMRVVQCQAGNTSGCCPSSLARAFRT